MSKNTKIITLVTTWLVFIAYILLGTLANLWHPAWLVFLLIPIVEEFCEFVKTKSLNRCPVGLIVIGTYLLIGFVAGIWHPTWVMLCAIPLYYITINAFPEKGKSVKE